jgi:hypothetical protein
MINKTLLNNLARIFLSCGQISSRLVVPSQRNERSKVYNLNEMPCIITSAFAECINTIIENNSNILENIILNKRSVIITLIQKFYNNITFYFINVS